ncbi:glycosyltransferase family 2 protein, partial [Gemmatimonadota bacterium]
IRAGGRIWQSPRIQYTFICRDNIGRLFKQYFQYGFWKTRVIQKHGMPASIRHLVPGVFVSSLMFLTLTSPFSGLARTGLLGIVAFYATVIVAASMWICRKPTLWKYLPILPFILSTFHIAYGFGFLKGVWDFIILGKHKRGGIQESTLSR